MDNLDVSHEDLEWVVTIDQRKEPEWHKKLQRVGLENSYFMINDESKTSIIEIQLMCSEEKIAELRRVAKEQNWILRIEPIGSINFEF